MEKREREWYANYVSILIIIVVILWYFLVDTFLNVEIKDHVFRTIHLPIRKAVAIWNPTLYLRFRHEGTLYNFPFLERGGCSGGR